MQLNDKEIQSGVLQESLPLVQEAGASTEAASKMSEKSDGRTLLFSCRFWASNRIQMSLKTGTDPERTSGNPAITLAPQHDHHDFLDSE